MLGNSHLVLQLGLELLKEGCIKPEKLDPYSDAFALLDIDIKAGLKLAGLRSIFSDSTTAARYYSPCKLDPEPCKLDPKTINYPDQEVEPSDFTKVSPSNTAPQNALVQLERYGSFVATTADQQIPVYDLFKSAAAIQDCLDEGEKSEPFLLVSADFSGIQDTVYTISSKGALKTLRARSFALELLTEHIIYEILKMSKAGRHAIIYSGGGGFALLLPNKDCLKGKIEEFGGVLNEWAYSEFFGKLFIALDVWPFKAEEAFQTLRQDQSDRLDKQKRQKFINQLDKLFEPKMPKQTSVQTECQITRRDDLPDGKMRDIGLEDGARMTAENKLQDGRIWVSESSFHQFKLGDKLIEEFPFICRSNVELQDKKKHYGCLKFPTKDSEVKNFKYCWYYLSESRAALPPYWHINSWNGNSTPILYADYVRKHGELSDAAKDAEIEAITEVEKRNPKDEDTATFEGLSASSCGADLIGSLRMDVDNMGRLFADIEKLSELSAKSRMLNLFFKVYLNEICRANLSGEPVKLKATDIVKKKYAENKGRNVSVIYAGGDDLFILGAWDETAELAFDIQRCFALFTGGSLDKEKQTVTGGRGISGGLTLHQPKFPLYQMARKSGEAEHVAKHDRDVIHDDPTKNRIALFYNEAKHQRKSKMQNSERYMLSMTWDLSNVFLLPLMETYRECGDLKIQDGRCVLEIEKFSYQTIEKWFAIIKKYQERNQLYLPTMARVMSQVKEGLGEENSSLFKDLIGFLYTNDESKKDWISHLHIALNWLSFLRRKE